MVEKLCVQAVRLLFLPRSDCKGIKLNALLKLSPFGAMITLNLF